MIATSFSCALAVALWGQVAPLIPPPPNPGGVSLLQAQPAGEPTLAPPRPGTPSAAPPTGSAPTAAPSVVPGIPTIPTVPSPPAGPSPPANAGQPAAKSPALAPPALASPALTPPAMTPPGAFPAAASQATPLEAAATPPAVSGPAIPATATPAGVIRASSEQAAPLVNVDGRGPKANAAEMIDSLLTLPDDLHVKGRSTALVELLASASDPSRQIAVTHAYWRLTAAVIELRLAHDSLRRLEQLQSVVSAQAQARGRASGAWELQSRQAAARARRAEAEWGVVTFQHLLAERAGLNPDGPLPLPSDRPHVGSYLTHLAQVYSGRPAPIQARLFDRQAPLRHEAIGQQAAAVQSAFDAVGAAIDALTRGEVLAASVWPAVDDLDRASRALVESVRDYNLDIASYALAIPRGALSPQDLVGMLIKPLRSPPAVNGAGPPTVVRPHTIQDGNVAPATYDEPTRAVPRNEPTPAVRREAHRVSVTDGPETGLYPALMNQPPSARAQDLAGLPHWDQSLPEEIGQPVTLAECLRAAPADQRAAAVEAFWQTREWVARYGVAVEKLGQLDALQSHAAGRTKAAGAAETDQRLHTARLLARGELMTIRQQLAAAQARLMQVMGRSADRGWLYAATAPHGGRYQLKLDAIPTAAAASPAVQRAAAAIPTLYRAVEERALSVVLADARRVESTNRFISGDVDESPLEAIERQADESVAFLQALTRYNREIGEYALGVLPAGAPVEMVVQALVVRDTSSH